MDSLLAQRGLAPLGPVGAGHYLEIYSVVSSYFLLPSMEVYCAKVTLYFPGQIMRIVDLVNAFVIDVIV